MNPKGVQIYGQVHNSADTSVLELVPLEVTNSTNVSDTVYGVAAFSMNYVFNGAQWDRVSALVTTSDGQAADQAGLMGVVARLQGFNGATFDRYRVVADNADARAVATAGHYPCVAELAAFNGTAIDRVRTNAAAVVAATTQPFAALNANPGEWSAAHAPVANTQATATRAAGAAGVHHICRSISATLCGLTGSAEVAVQINVRDGATGAGAILWSQTLMVIPAGVTGIALAGLNIVGSAATAMTIEFSAAGGANTYGSVAMTGYSTV